MYKLKVCPCPPGDRNLYVRTDSEDWWEIWSPNGEFWYDKHHGDCLPDSLVAAWEEVVIGEQGGSTGSPQ